MIKDLKGGLVFSVALLAEGVDRNLRHGLKMQGAYVALLAEGVDRNKMSALTPVAARVALLAEGVDRNSCAWPPD